MTEEHELLECKQAVPIAKLESTTEQINKTLEKLSAVLERMATQGTKVEILEKNQDEIFGRLRKTELNVAQIATKVSVAAGFVAAVTSAVIAVTGKLVK